MTSKGMNCVRGLIPHGECRECMLNAGHPCGIPADMLEMMRGNNTEREQSGVKFSPSTLLGCQRQHVLSRGGDYWIDVEGSAFYQMRGHMVHALMDTQGAYPGILGVIREQRFSKEVQTKYGPQVMMGKADLITLLRIEDGVLHVKVTDYKSKTDVGHDLDSADRKHQMQVNLYAWLVSETLVSYDLYQLTTARVNDNAHLDDVTRVIVDELEIVYVDMRKVRTFTSAMEDGKNVFPMQAKGKKLRPYNMNNHEWMDLAPIFMMDMNYVGRWVVKHIEMAIEAEKELPSPLGPDEARKQCHFCTVRTTCVEMGEAEGIDMSTQRTA